MSLEVLLPERPGDFSLLDMPGRPRFGPLPEGMTMVSANNPIDGPLCPALPEEDRMRARRCPAGTTTRYAQRLHSGTELILEVVIFGPRGPQCVWSEAPDGSKQQWRHRWEARDILVFRAPDGYGLVGGPEAWLVYYWYDPNCQRAEPLRLKQTTVYSFPDAR